MGRPRKPASMKKGKSETKAQLKVREAQEQRLMGETGKVQNVPEYLDPLAKAYYKYIVTELEVSELLSNLDIPLVEQTADSLSKIRQCDDILNSEGVIIRQLDRYGNEITKDHPAVKVKMQYINVYKALSAQLGMSPTSRAQLAGMQVEAKEEEEDPVLQLLKG